MAFDLRSFIRDVRDARRSDDPLGRVRALLEQVVGLEPRLIEAQVPRAPEEALLDVADDMTVFHIRLAPGLEFPPHEHGMPALLALYQGVETNVFFARDGRRLARVGEQAFKAPAVAVLPPDVIHAVCNRGDAPSAALHIYLGNLLTRRRSLWHPESHVEHPYDQDAYVALARTWARDAERA